MWLKKAAGFNELLIAVVPTSEAVASADVDASGWIEIWSTTPSRGCVAAWDRRSTHLIAAPTSATTAAHNGAALGAASVNPVRWYATSLKVDTQVAPRWDEATSCGHNSVKQTHRC